MRVFRIVVAALLLIILLALPATAGAEGELSFEEGGFKILLIADTQDTDHPVGEMLKLIEASLDTAQPDMVVFLGDQIHPMLMGADEQRTREAIAAVVEPVVKREIPFAIVFGNHDDEGGVSKEKQLEYYRSFPGCIASEGDVTGVGNYNALIYGGEGKPLFNLWFFDSGTYDTSEGGKYACVQQDQIDWYVSRSRELEDEYGELPAFAFQHIIVPEIYDMLKEVPAGTEGAIEGFNSHEGKYYTLDPEIFTSGSMNEHPCPPDRNGGQFEAWVQRGDIKAAFFGHDHTNDFLGSYKGIDIAAVPGAGFYIYGNGEYHGTRLVTIDEDTLSYTTELIYYKDVVGKAPFYIATHWGVLIETAVLVGIVLAGGLCAGVFFAARALVRKRRRLMEKTGTGREKMLVR